MHTGGFCPERIQIGQRGELKYHMRDFLDVSDSNTIVSYLPTTCPILVRFHYVPLPIFLNRHSFPTIMRNRLCISSALKQDQYRPKYEPHQVLSNITTL